MESNSKKSNRRILTGVVKSDKMMKTVKVMVSRKFRHARYEKVVESRKTFTAHNEIKDISVGDKVVIMECRPMSKTKRWVVVSKA